MLWPLFFPHAHAEAELQFCHYYHFGPVPKGKHARIQISGNEVRKPDVGAISLVRAQSHCLDGRGERLVMLDRFF